MHGVRQGGVLSPILFTVYIDELLQHLQKLGVGCHWEGMFVGGLCYADDLALIAPSAHALRRMLQVCSSVVKSHVLQSFCTYFMVLPYGNWHVLNSNFLRQHLTKINTTENLVPSILQP